MWLLTMGWVLWLGRREGILSELASTFVICCKRNQNLPRWLAFEMVTLEVHDSTKARITYQHMNYLNKMHLPCPPFVLFLLGCSKLIAQSIIISTQSSVVNKS